MVAALVLLFWQAPLPHSPAMMEFHRTGGFAGFDDHITIYTNGTAAITSRSGKRSKNIPPKEVTFLTRQLRTSGLLQRDSSNLSEGADHITYGIKYKGVRVTFNDEKVPPKLQAALQHFLNLLVSR